MSCFRFLDPVVNGHYPHSMRKYVGSRLPEFSEIESEKLRGSFDFLGVNYYTAQYVSDASNTIVETLSYTTDPKVKYTSKPKIIISVSCYSITKLNFDTFTKVGVIIFLGVRNGIPIGQQVRHL